MKRLSIMKAVYSVCTAALLFVGCTMQDATITIQNEAKETAVASKVANDGWSVQVKGKTIGFTDNSSYPERYKNESTGLFMKVVSSDPKTSSSAGGPRTELKSTSGKFTAGSGHKMVVTMKLVKSTERIVVGQLFSDGIGSDFVQVLLYNRRLVARDADNNSQTLNNDVGTGAFTFTINSSGGKTVISSNGNSFTRTAKPTNCYFKTGVYLLAGGSAEIRITSISKT
jgi:hypothetical protein